MIVGIGSLVSFAVMRDAVGDINKLIFKPMQHSHRFIPKNIKDLKSAVSAIGKLFIFATGFYFVGFPVAFVHIFSHYPFIASAMLSSFAYTAACTAQEAYSYYQPMFRNFSIPSFRDPSPNKPQKSAPTRNGFGFFGFFNSNNPNTHPPEQAKTATLN